MEYRITLRGIAVVQAEEAGLISKTKEGYDISAFLKFWDKFEPELWKYVQEHPEDAIEVFYDKPEKERDDRHYYRNLILRSIATFFIGSILMALLEAFGLGCFLFSLLLCFLSYGLLILR